VDLTALSQSLFPYRWKRNWAIPGGSGNYCLRMAAFLYTSMPKMPQGGQAIVSLRALVKINLSTWALKHPPGKARGRRIASYLT